MKAKTHKGTVKRIKRTKTGKMLKGKVHNSHLARKEDTSSRMRKKRTDEVSKGYAKKVRKLTKKA
jgi:large subunit ribosomal protein L35